ncbi:toxin VasX [Shewanella algae]|uniref:toxin VasX n=1 Tax=Shewanella algae TaxID=38313 RepID=UPI001184A3B7|nr:toxin VasX [Shewanella algae]TVP01312.1 hypothetical protein AYI73_21055 [Shewanella algae]BCV39587.1 hypothetical protein TUM17378_08490 [Shewanella algae]
MSADRQQQDANDKATQESDTKAGSLLATCPLKAQTVKIVPVRYALDEFQLVPEPCPKHNLPSEGNFPGGYFSKQLKCNSYTLRQLTDGWLYVWNQTEKTLHEYEVKGPQLIRYQFGDNEADKPLSERGTALEPKVYLEYNRGSELYLMFSQLRCSWPMLEHYRSNGEAQRRWGRKLSLPGFCRTMAEPHTAPIKVLSQVADIAGEAKFPLAVPSLQDRGEGDETLSGKPVQPLTTYLGPISDKDSALMVALDDIWSDINDMMSQVAYLPGQMHELDETEVYRRMNAQAVIQLCGAGDMLSMEDWMHSERLPPKIRGNKLAISRYLDKVSDYAYEKEQWNIAVQRASRKLNDSFDLPSSEVFKRLEKEIVEEYGRVPVIPSGWEKNKKKRQYADLQAAEDFLAEHLKHDSDLNDEIELRVEELFSCHLSIPPDARIVGADCHHPEHQFALTNWIGENFELLMPFIDGPIKERLMNALWHSDKPEALIILSYSGFDSELYDGIRQILSHFPEDPNATGSNSVALANNANSRVKEIFSAFDEIGLMEHDWATRFHGDALKTLTAMRDALGHEINRGWTNLMHAFLPLIHLKRQDIAQAGNISSLISPRKMLGMTLIASFVNDEKLAPNGDYHRNKNRADKEVKNLSGKLAKQKGILERGYLPNRNAEQVKLGKIEAEWAEAFSQQKINNSGWLAVLKNNEVMEQYRVKVDNAMKLFASKGATALKSLGIGRVAVLLNLWNLCETPMPKEIGLDAIDPYNSSSSSIKSKTLISNMGYLSAALTAIWYDTAWEELKDNVKNAEGKLKNASPIYKIRHHVGKETKAILKLSLKEAADIRGKDFSNLLKNFRGLARIMGAATIVASVFELIVIGYDLGYFGSKGKDYNELERGIVLVKGVATAVTVISGTYVLLMGFGLAAGIAWMGPLAAVAGVVYLITSVLQELIFRDDLDKWLEKSSFGKLKLWLNNPAAEFQHLMDCLIKPFVYAEACFDVIIGAEGYMRHDVKGCWIVFRLPLKGMTVDISEVYYKYRLWGLEQWHDPKLNELIATPISEETFNKIIRDGLPDSLENIDFLSESKDPELASNIWLLGVKLDKVSDWFVKDVADIWLEITRPESLGVSKSWQYTIESYDLIWRGKNYEHEAIDKPESFKAVSLRFPSSKEEV